MNVSIAYPSASVYRLITVDRFFQRLVGLMGRKSIDPRHVYHFVPCNSIHTFGMAVPLTVIFLDRQFRVLRVIKHLAPARVAWHCRACSVLELRTGSITSNRQARELVALLLPSDAVRKNGWPDH
ncbi:hypothetical protein TKWG_14690 [Advenella kashmirensis WT001]|uniref:DUF192 domain-containing protein n=1 Tax=Advenella kashmirensis (strain DSM 17095 / LMG 22695 / WT001) TaxID=1036672 RepID=I3UD98_ADVKW|nr:DUF192 domain-containing protein [Advenella kashmirensis]AFK62986.1 hypothetical protein TKWG_14690 [Advenella kashmirensis WT001]